LSFETQLSDKPIVLMTKCMNPGSYFIHSLLDGSSELLVFPFVICVNTLNLLEQKSSNLNTFADEYFDNYFVPMYTSESISVNSTHKTTNNEVIGKALESIFTSQFISDVKERFLSYPVKTLSLASFITNLFESYCSVLGLDTGNIKTIFAPIHIMFTNLNCSGAPYYGKYFNAEIKNDSRLKIFHVTRDFRANYSSGVYSRNHGKRNKLRALHELIREKSNNIDYFARLLGPDRFYCLASNDVHREPDKELGALSQWLGIKYEPAIMHTSTIAGHPWSGNSDSGVIDCFDRDLSSNKFAHERLLATDRAILKLVEQSYYSKKANKSFGFYVKALQTILYFLIFDTLEYTKDIRVRTKVKSAVVYGLYCFREWRLNLAS
jgi:hypothetical protein